MISYTDDAMSRYFKLLETEPELFRNIAGGVEILVDPTLITLAQDAVRERRSSTGLPVDDVRTGMLANDPYMTMVRDAVRFPDGSFGLHNRVIERGSVAALPLLNGKPVLIKIFRHGLRDWSLEFPRGGRDLGESGADAVRRELHEEIGAHVLNLWAIGDFTPGGSSLSVVADLFVASIDNIGAPQSAEGIAEILVVSIDELEVLIASGRIVDGFTMSLFARARLKGFI